jgi:poly(A) polymerase
MDDESAYAGRWVARLRGKIIAQGSTPEEAKRAAQRIRHKETPEIVFMPPTQGFFDPLLETIAAALPADQPLYLVGGAVRDRLLNRLTHDLDFVLPGNALAIGRRLARALDAAYYPLDEERGTARLILKTEDGTRLFLDFASYRGADLESDLRGRDFTINAMAWDIRSHTLIDILGGAKDLKDKILRACSPSTFEDDPVRILRAVRQAAAFGLHILPETRQAMRQAAQQLIRVSPERLRDEIFRILEGPRPSACLRALDLLGILPLTFPELPALKGIAQPQPHVHDAWTHTLAVLDHLEIILNALAPTYDPEKAADLLNGLLVLRLGRYRQQIGAHLASDIVPERSLRGLLFLAALYHDISKPDSSILDENGNLHFYGHDKSGAEVIARRASVLHFSSDEIKRLKTIVANHMRFHFHVKRLNEENKEPTRRAIYRFFRAANSAGVDLVLLGLADLRATYEQTLPQETWKAALDIARTLLENWWEKPEETVAPPRLLTGTDLLSEFTLTPGPQIGALLEAVREAQAMGLIINRAQALEFVRQRLNETAQGEK